MGDLGRIWVSETGTEGWTVGHCEILEGMGEMVGLGEGQDGRLGEGGDSWL